jgi:hypothetical protein
MTPHATSTNPVNAPSESLADSESPHTSDAATTPTDGDPSARSLTEQFLTRLERIQEDAVAVSRVLPGAVARCVQSGGLGEALTPAVERALLLISRRDPRSLAEALTPSVGTALRRSVWASMSRFFKHVNFWMLQHVSMKGMQWRMEAHRRGKSFEEVVTEHTQASPVRQVFLIHRETGLVLQEAQSLSTSSPQDWDIISCMLTALQDFIHDSFDLNQDTPLETIKVGEVTVLIEQGPHAAVAGILDGNMRPEYATRFKDACSRIHGELSEELSSFDGDTAPFDTCAPYLDSCMHNLINPSRLPILPQTMLALLLPFLLLATWILPGVVESVRWKNYVLRLTGEPGIIVIDHGRKDGAHFVTGLRDPLAANPQDLLVQAGFTPSDVSSHWEPFQGLSSTLALARARRLLNPPDSVVLDMRDNILTLEGTATRDWIRSARESLQRWIELDKFNMDGLSISNAGAQSQWVRFLTHIDREPGLSVITTGIDKDGRFTIVGLADPLARSPDALLAETGLAPGDVIQQWAAYQSPDPRIAEKRARHLLNPPESVNLSVRDGVLHLEGEAPAPWIRLAETLSKSIPGVRNLYVDHLVNTDQRNLNQAIGRIEQNVFRLLAGAPDLRPGQAEKLTQLTKDIAQLRRSARRNNIDFLIEIRGHTAPTGAKQRDTLLAESLARSFLELLSRQSEDTRLFTRRSLGSTPPEIGGATLDKPDDRLVSFKVLLLD